MKGKDETVTLARKMMLRFCCDSQFRWRANLTGKTHYLECVRLLSGGITLTARKVMSASSHQFLFHHGDVFIISCNLQLV
jgi:hypothetical protein